MPEWAKIRQKEPVVYSEQTSNNPMNTTPIHSLERGGGFDALWQGNKNYTHLSRTAWFSLSSANKNQQVRM